MSEPNWAKLEYLYRVNGWVSVEGHWVDVHGKGFTPESVEDATALFGED